MQSKFRRFAIYDKNDQQVTAREQGSEELRTSASSPSLPSKQT